MTQFLLSILIGLPLANLLAHLSLDDDTGRNEPAADLSGLVLQGVLVAGAVVVSAVAVLMWGMARR